MESVLRIKKIFIHCSDTNDSKNFGVDDIREWHITQNQWDDIGYHYVIDRHATVEVGRGVNQEGAAVYGYNMNSISICIVGRNKFTADQIEAALTLVLGLVRKYGLKVSDVLGHYEVDAKKTCPNIEMNVFRGALQAMIHNRNLIFNSGVN